MRIRKNAKISQLSSISSTPSSSSTSISNPLLLKTHQYLQCQLNQSPWDIITFPQDPSSPHFQVDEDCEFAGNGSYGESIGAIQSAGSMKMCMESDEMCSDDRKWADWAEENWEERKTNVGFIKEEEDEKVAVLSGETNRKGWQRGRVVKNGHTTCVRHLKRGEVSVGKKSDGTSTPARRGRGRPRIKKKEKEPAKNPNEFYYYSGFGPHWGKKKGSGRTIDNNVTGTGGDLGTGVKNNIAKSAIEDEGLDYMECDDDDDDDDIEDEITGKRRGRKRIKARSLKSLM